MVVCWDYVGVFTVEVGNPQSMLCVICYARVPIGLLMRQWDQCVPEAGRTHPVDTTGIAAVI